MSSFSPGPWNVTGKKVVQNSEGETIALCNFANPSQKDEVSADEANAVLIAAAPTMFETLYLASESIKHECEPGMVFAVCLRCKVDYALNRARGLR